MNSSQSNIILDVSVDCVVFGFHADQLKVLLLKSDDIGIWSVPRGKVFRNEPMADAASRIVQETAGISDIFLQQFHTFGASDHYRNLTLEQRNILDTNNNADSELYHFSTISVGYYALVDFEKVTPHFDGQFQWCEVKKLPDLIFDHHDMIEYAWLALRKDLRYLPIAKLLPQKFTLREMQKLYETILNRTFDRRNFHKLLMSYDFLIKLPEKRYGVANKSPHLYQIDFEKYETALQDGISY